MQIFKKKSEGISIIVPVDEILCCIIHIYVWKNFCTYHTIFITDKICNIILKIERTLPTYLQFYFIYRYLVGRYGMLSQVFLRFLHTYKHSNFFLIKLTRLPASSSHMDRYLITNKIAQVPETTLLVFCGISYLQLKFQQNRFSKLSSYKMIIVTLEWEHGKTHTQNLRETGKK